MRNDYEEEGEIMEGFESFLFAIGAGVIDFVGELIAEPIVLGIFIFSLGAAVVITILAKLIFSLVSK